MTRRPSGRLRLLTNYCGVDLRCCHSLRKLNVALLRLAPSLVCAVHLDLLATFLSSLVVLIDFVNLRAAFHGKTAAASPKGGPDAA